MTITRLTVKTSLSPKSPHCAKCPSSRSRSAPGEDELRARIHPAQKSGTWGTPGHLQPWRGTAPERTRAPPGAALRAIPSPPPSPAARHAPLRAGGEAAQGVSDP